MPAFRSFVPAKRSPPYSLPSFARLDSAPTAPVSSPRACRNRPLPHCTKRLAAPPLALQSVSAAPLFPPTSASPPIALPPPSPKAPSAAPPTYLALRLTIGSVCYIVSYVTLLKIRQVLSLLSRRSNPRSFKGLRTLLRSGRTLTSSLSISSELFLS